MVQPLKTSNGSAASSVNAAERTGVLLDPHPLWLDALEGILERLDVRVGLKTTSPDEVLASLDDLRPDLIVAEVETPEGEIDGIECLLRAREQVPSLRGIIISSLAEPSYIDRALAAGASAYVLKTAHPEDFASAIRQAFSSSIFLAGPRPVPASATPARAAQKPAADLTTRELEILQLVAEGLSNGEMARRLWVTEQTVKFHLSNIYRKLDVANRTQASRWAQVNGLLSTSRAAGE
jgi:DNA-binding NarL/FixJ family response regulator